MKKKKKINVGLQNNSYDIFIGDELLSNLEDKINSFIKNKKCFIITDSNVDNYYGDFFLNKLSGFTDYQIIKYSFPAGEQNKTLKTVEDIYHYAFSKGLDRSSVIIALGGGVCGDMAGFTAATFMRGIDFIQIPTSLLAMVDSSVGGKTGVDMPEGKNLVGVFLQPKTVLIDPNTLKTLPVREIRGGLAEIIKYGMIIDLKLFEYIESNIEKINSLDTDVISELIAWCCKIKADIVAKDEKEHSLRAILNFGHTFGHAIETVSGYEKYIHGEGIAIGMLMACRLAVTLGMIEKNIEERLKHLFIQFSLPVKSPGISPDDILKAMYNDKKVRNNNINFILPYKKIGKVEIVDSIDNKLVLEAVKAYV
ncbi:MAG: 3-dehydroquinate synthase [bacterium]|nr:3-dehydroquinate synthase [bacterium]